MLLEKFAIEKWHRVGNQPNLSRCTVVSRVVELQALKVNNGVDYRQGGVAIFRVYSTITSESAKVSMIFVLSAGVSC